MNQILNNDFELFYKPSNCTTMGPSVVLLHSKVPGRIRISVSGLKNSPTLKTWLESILIKLPMINRVEANIVTGNSLINYDTHVSVSELLKQITSELKRLASGRYPVQKPATSEADNTKPADQTEGQQAEDASLWHKMSIRAIEGELITSTKSGLSTVKASQLYADVGPNALATLPGRSKFSCYLDQLLSWPVALLSASAAVALVTGGIVDAAVIMGVVAINAVIGGATEYHAEQTINALSHVDYDDVTVIRNGEKTTVPLERIVPGDLLVLLPGHFVAADARIVNASHLTIDESALTGESVPVSKSSAVIRGKHISLGDRTNMVYKGTLVTGGNGLALVVSTGANTQIGLIQSMVGQTTPPQTPMQKHLDRLGTKLVILCSGVCALVFAIGLLRGQSFFTMVQSAISLAVAAVPEGLPTVATSTLALGLQDMRKQGILIRQLNAVEALGALEVICLDKTGTLTENHMRVVSVCLHSQQLALEQNVFHCEGGAIDPLAHDDLIKLMQVSVLCNDSELIENSSTTAVSGTPTENALLEMALEAGLDYGLLCDEFPREQTLYRSENRQYMATLHKQGDRKFVAVKGSPVEVLDFCQWKLVNGEVQPLAEEDKEHALAANDAIAGDGLRVLGFAYAADANGTDLDQEQLVWLGLVGMTDPLRPEVKDAIKRFHGAGIKTVMITGDQSATAYTIGRQLSLNGGDQIKIMDSSDLHDLDLDVLSTLSQQVQVFARVSPQHKLRIVQALQHAGKVVSMTGDGINDSPALKAADVGIAMGDGGTEAARSVADAVLESDDLNAMITAISRGRTIHTNIRKSLHFLVATNISEIFVMLGSIAAGFGQPLSPMQLLWINLVTDIFPGLALSLEPPEPDVMEKPPRDPHEPIITNKQLKVAGIEAAQISATTLGAYAFGLFRYGNIAHAGTLAFNTLTTSQLLHSLTCRSENKGLMSGEALKPNPYLSVALAGSFAAQGLVQVVPGLRKLLGSTPLNLIDIPVIAVAAIIPYLLTEARKALPGKRDDNDTDYNDTMEHLHTQYDRENLQ